MASTCISNCVNDARAPVRATYVNLYKWPESDVEFVRSLSSDKRKTGSACGHPKVVDSISCRQLYLRSYTFSRDECMDEKAKKTSRARRIRERMNDNRRKRKSRGRGGSDGGSRKCTGFRRAKEASYVAMASIFRRLLSCTTKVDVVG